MYVRLKYFSNSTIPFCYFLLLLITKKQTHKNIKDKVRRAIRTLNLWKHSSMRKLIGHRGVNYNI